jgi:carbamoyltransferase
MRIIGINNEMYISSACLIEDGRIVAAGAEERFTRQKLTRQFPTEAITYCLKEGGLTMQDVDYVATSWNPGVYFSKFNPVFSGRRRHLVEQLYSVPDYLMAFYGRPQIDYVFQEACGEFGASRAYHITHHRAHAANGFFLSPFDTAAILTADAQGETESVTFGRGRDNAIHYLKSMHYPHSLGMLYSTFTEYLGFVANSDEWKVMALASYADPDNEFLRLFREHVIRFGPEGSFELNLSLFSGFLHEQPRLFTETMSALFGPARRKDESLEDRHYELAAALQKITEDVAVHMIIWLYERTGEKNLVLSGGSFMNSVFNGRVLDLTPFEQLFVSSSPDDSGNCFGAAFYLYNHILGNKRGEAMVHNYYGPQYSDPEIRQVLSGYNLSFQHDENVCASAARMLAAGKIIGWFQGRMEFGQRALGNRSILTDPRRAEMKDKVNRAVKFRESFRPFAPAVLKERQNEYFDMDAGSEVPFMEKVYPVKAEQRGDIPAVVHVDGSGRIQSVDRETNERFYTLISEFEKITGVPVVLNTSFNLNGEPIVCSPVDAIRTFFSCGLDVLVLGNYIVSKAGGA